MQLSSRILTALAVLILAVAVVAVRAGSPGTVEAATGTIDVVNVGTCYTTDTDVFDVSACDDGDGGDYNVAGRTTITETGSVYATYSHDPKTAPDDPRGVLKNSNLIKVSIADTGRDKRTAVLLAAGQAENSNVLLIPVDIPETDADESVVNPNLQFIRDDLDDQGLEIDDEGLRWQLRGGAFTDGFDEDPADGLSGNGVINGITIIKNPELTGEEEPNYRPMDVADDSSVSIYGTITVGTVVSKFMNLKNELSLDEDVGSGFAEHEQEQDSAEVAPWISIQKSMEQGATIQVMYIVYHTSEREVLIGGRGEAGYTASSEESPDFTSAENKAESPLLIEARSDGRDNKQQLWLKETSRFSGRYEGELILTDENGDGGDSSNWGMSVRSGDATNPVAVIGVESGPVDIAYKDTDGKTQVLSVLIDTVPPIVQIDTPVHKSEGQDTSPNFSGSYTDDNSGLRKDTFRLYVDHDDDLQESGDTGEQSALSLPVDVSADEDGVVESLEEYRGYTTNSPTFGVIGQNDVFFPDIDDDPDLKEIEGDNHDDGSLDGTFGDSVRISFLPEDDYNNTIDFHALVVDVAGNIGFSDSDADGPRFINNLGEVVTKRKDGRYNILGWYARHIFFLDETDPVIFQEQSATGFYGENDDGDPVVNRSGILVAFDRAVDTDSFGIETFGVTLDPTGGPGSTGASAAVVDIDVDGRAVYLLLDQELSSDATPSVDIVTGQWVSDPAGNRLTGGKQATVRGQ